MNFKNLSLLGILLFFNSCASVPMASLQNDQDSIKGCHRAHEMY